MTHIKETTSSCVMLLMSLNVILPYNFPGDAMYDTCVSSVGGWSNCFLDDHSVMVKAALAVRFVKGVLLQL